MDRRNFLGSIAALGCGALLDVNASSLPNFMTSAAAKASKKGFDENLVLLISDLHTNPGKYQEEYLRKTTKEILAMRPLPRNVVAMGDLAYLTGRNEEYAVLKEVLVEPLEAAGITLTMAMGNHDRRENFAKAFPTYAAKSKQKDRFTFIVETPHADIIVLDSLQQGEDTTTWITPGALNEEQKTWLQETLANYKKPVFVSSHHPIKELDIQNILLEAPTCCGYIYGHDHRWRPEWFVKGYRVKRMLRTLCLPSTGHWGDIGYVFLHLDEEKAVASLQQSEFFFPHPVDKGETIPTEWKAICEDHLHEKVTFMYERP